MTLWQGTFSVMSVGGDKRSDPAGRVAKIEGHTPNHGGIHANLSLLKNCAPVGTNTGVQLYAVAVSPQHL